MSTTPPPHFKLQKRFLALLPSPLLRPETCCGGGQGTLKPQRQQPHSSQGRSSLGSSPSLQSAADSGQLQEPARIVRGWQGTGGGGLGLRCFPHHL